MAYPIKHIHQGHYVLVEFDMKKEHIKGLDRALRLTTEVLRHMIVTKRVKTEAELIKEEKLKERLLKAKEKEFEEKKEEKKEVKVEKPDTKVSIEELDKKLDEILDKDII